MRHVRSVFQLPAGRDEDSSLQLATSMGFLVVYSTSSASFLFTAASVKILYFFFLTGAVAHICSFFYPVRFVSVPTPVTYITDTDTNLDNYDKGDDSNVNPDHQRTYDVFINTENVFFSTMKFADCLFQSATHF